MFGGPVEPRSSLGINKVLARNEEVTMDPQGTYLGQASLSIRGRDIGSISQRGISCAAGPTLLWSTIAGLTGGRIPARASGLSRQAQALDGQAQALAAQIPPIDRLSVRVITDSYYTAFVPSHEVGNVAVERFGLPLSEQPPGRTVQNEFGLAWHVASTRGTESRNVLLDFGYTGETYNNNFELFGIAPEKIDALMLTHGHYDHFGGLTGFLAKQKSRLRVRIPFYVGGEEAFCARQALIGPVPTDFGMLDRRSIENASLEVLFADQPCLVAGHGFATGRIPEVSFERIFAPTQMRVDSQRSPGELPGQSAKDQRSAPAWAYIADDFAHETALAFHVKGRGLVVMSSCSHRGVVNAVKQAMAVSGLSKVHAVLGGFHLAPHQQDYVRKTVLALKELDPDVIVPMHCTGEAFMDICARELPGKIVRSYTGSCYVFGT